MNALPRFSFCDCRVSVVILTRNNIGHGLYRQKRYAEAIKHFEIALMHRKRSSRVIPVLQNETVLEAMPLRGLAFSYLHLREFEKALAPLRELCSLQQGQTVDSTPFTTS